MNLPTLYKKTSTGKTQMWQISVQLWDRTGEGLIVTEYGLLDGKKQRAEEVIISGKNAGKSNATTPYKQAELEAKSQWEAKKKKGYVESVEDAVAGKVDALIKGGINPMLAHGYDKQSNKISFPAFAQPKLDGHRCIAIVQDGKATLWSRTRKRITGVPHIERELEKMFSDVDIVLDGELYNHDYREKFEELTSFIRQVDPKPGHEVVQYWIYDVIVDGAFTERMDVLQQIVQALNTPTPIAVVHTSLVDDEEDLMGTFAVYLDYGFEGAMVRNGNGLYKHGRSYDLQKVKQFEDAEFTVIDVEEGKGKMAGRAMFVCETPEGGTFRVKMIGALDDLVYYFQNKDEFIGKLLTVKFQGTTNAQGVPRFPVAMRFHTEL